MSSAPIVVRYDAQNSEKVVSDTNKIVGSLNALRTSSGQTATTVKQMESGFSTNALGNFNTAITNADSRITGFRTKLAGIGQQFSQNATSFGVATASIWGVYNAYDSLEKVQIRANAAATRVATLETTIATLTQRRAEAVANGNLSAEEMAILDERITNGHAKLAVAQQRNADLQGDVNEAWAGFASQVGPQAVAAGGAVVQLVTNLRGSMGGIIPSIKGFFGSLMGGNQVMAQSGQQSLLLGQNIGNLKAPMEGAAIATRGLSTAMKGLLIGTGVGIAITAIGLIAEHFTNTAEAAETGSEDIEGSLGEMDASFSGSEGAVKQWGGTVHKMVDGTVIVVKDAASQVKESLSGLAQELRTEFPGLTPEFIAGKNVEIQSQIDALTSRRSGLLAGTIKPEAPFRNATAEAKALEAQIKTLNKDIAENENLLQLMFGTMSKGSEDAKTLGASLDTAGASVKELLDEGAGLTELFTKWQSGQMADAGPDLAARYELFKKGFMQYKEGVQSAIPPTEEFLKYQDEMKVKLFLSQFQTVQEANALEQEAQQQEEANRVKKEAVAVMANVVAQTFGAAEAAQQAGESNADYATRMEQLSGIAEAHVDKEQQLILAYTKTAVALGINKTRQDELREAMHTSSDSVAALILSKSTLVDVLNDENRANELTTAGLVEGRTQAVAWYDQMVKQIALNEQFKEDQLIIAQHFADNIPAGLQLTKEQMESLIVTQNDLGENAEAMGQVLDEVFSASRAAFGELLDAATKGGKDWKEAWKDVKNLFPKEVRDDVKEFISDQEEMRDTLADIMPTLHAYTELWDDFSKKERAAATEKMGDAIQKLGDQLDDITDIDVQSTIIDPLLALTEGGLDTSELNTWVQFFEKYNELANDEEGITDEDVKILQDFVANNEDMGKLGEKTGETSDKTKQLSDNQKTLKENFLVAGTIKLITIQLENQKTAVEDLTTAFNDLTEAKNRYGGGGGGNGNNGNGPQNVSFQDNTEIPFIESDNNVQGGETVVTFSADLTQWDTAIKQVEGDVARIDALAPIVDLLADHRQYMKAAADVGKITAEIDKLRPIVDFLGDHRQFMRAGADVVKVVKAIDALRPIVDFMGDHSNSGNFMDAADDVESRADEIDGRVVTVTFKAKRVGNWSAQHGMDMFMTEDAVLAVHKNEHVKVTPPGAAVESSSSPIALSGGGGGGTPRTLQAFIQINLDKYQVLTKLMQEVPLEDTGMYPTA